MRHDLNWPVRTAKQLGIHRLFGKGEPAPQMNRETRAHLTQFYAADVLQLSQLLEIDLSIWQGEFL